MTDADGVKPNSNKIASKIVFLSTFSLALIGALRSEWNAVGVSNQWNPEFRTFDQLENFFSRVFSIAGFIDVFLFPALASSITITSSFVIFRRISSKLRRPNLKPALVILFIFSTAFIWLILSFLVAAISLAL